ncbi:unannotated protein [freshwater metagenome]|uniref:Unannotated protein n=1 Tax=freshwater metagenome TaxID=449393 RepID=A0A6J7DDU9_9ZZZZ|nr:spheroidene monooxygenase [Actinomycetota bacterium]
MNEAVSSKIVTVAYFWRISKSSIPFALLRMALDRGGLRRTKGVLFAKMLGTGNGETFTPKDADSTRWGAIITIEENQLTALDSSRIITRWRNKSQSEFRALLDPIASHGHWSKENPFSYSTTSANGAVIAITRARIATLKNAIFWSAVPPVTKSLHNSPGLIAAIGIGEAPLGLQGTFSYWKSAKDLKEFAYKSSAHQEVIAATARNKWYREELFARFSVREVRGEISSK